MRGSLRQPASRITQGPERVWVANLVDELPVDLKQRFIAAEIGDDVAVPQLFIERAGHSGALSQCSKVADSLQ